MQRTVIRPLNLAFSICAGLLLMAAAPGCQSGKSDPASFASVTIRNHTPDQIATAAVQVFAAEGYRARLGEAGQMMIFEKEASKATTLSREGLVGTYYGAVTVNRVKAQIFNLGDGASRLQCKAYIVRGAGDSFFEEEVPKANLRSGPYQSLLNKVAKQLESASK